MPHAKLTACSSVSPAPMPAFAARPKLRSRPRWFTISTSFATASRPPRDDYDAGAEPDTRLSVAGRPGPRRDAAEGRRQRHQCIVKFRNRCSSRRTLGHRPRDSYYESGKTVTAFIEAGALALAAIAILLFIALRRLTDVLLTLIPLLLAGAVTLEVCVLDGLALNFANIIALSLLLGVGVAFKIYYIMAWRAGKTGLLQSTLTRAVVFSALTNAVAFGSMRASSYPGMSSMGKMMALALLCTMAAAVLFQPVLMGRPRQLRAIPESQPRLRQAAAE
jgi:hypothetical protein